MPIARTVADQTLRSPIRGTRCEACDVGDVDGCDLHAFEVQVARSLTGAPTTGEAVKWVREALGYTAAELPAEVAIKVA